MYSLKTFDTTSWYLSIFGGFEKFSKNNSGKIWQGQKKIVPLHSLSEKNEGVKSSFCESARRKCSLTRFT